MKIVMTISEIKSYVSIAGEFSPEAKEIMDKAVFETIMDLMKGNKQNGMYKISLDKNFNVVIEVKPEDVIQVMDYMKDFIKAAMPMAKLISGEAMKMVTNINSVNEKYFEAEEKEEDEDDEDRTISMEDLEELCK